MSFAPQKPRFEPPPSAGGPKEIGGVNYGKIPSMPDEYFDPNEHVLFRTPGPQKPGPAAPPRKKKAAPKEDVVQVHYAKLPSMPDDGFNPEDHVVTIVYQDKDGKKVKKKKKCHRCEEKDAEAKILYQELKMKMCKQCTEICQNSELEMADVASKVRIINAEKNKKMGDEKPCERCEDHPQYAKADFEGELLAVCVNCVTEHPQFRAMLRQALNNIRAKNYDDARIQLVELCGMVKSHGPTLYNLACLEALDGNVEDGMKILDTALGCGYTRYKLVYKEDKDIKALRKLQPQWDELVAKYDLANKCAAQQGPGLLGRLLSGRRDSSQDLLHDSRHGQADAPGPVGPPMPQPGPVGPSKPTASGAPGPAKPAPGPQRPPGAPAGKNDPYMSKPYWRSTFDRRAAESYLKTQRPGHFIVRPSSQPGALSLSHRKLNGAIGHCFVHIYEGGRKGYAVENETEHFNTIEELIKSLSDLDQTLNV